MANAKSKAVDQNEQFRIAQFTVDGEYSHTYGVYILNPGDCFQGFGGSSSGLVVRKTPSLIVRDLSVMGCVDTEYSINDRKCWTSILHCFKASK